MADASRKRLASPPAVTSNTDLPCISISAEESSSNDESVGWELDRRQRRKKARLVKTVKSDASETESSATSSAIQEFRVPKATARQTKTTQKSRGESRRDAEGLKCPPGVCLSAEEGTRKVSPSTRDSGNRSEGDTTMFPLPAGGKQPSPNSKKGRERAAAVSEATGPGMDMPVLDTDECGKQDRARSPATISTGGKGKVASHSNKGCEVASSRSTTSPLETNEGLRGTGKDKLNEKNRRCSEATQKKRYEFALITEKIDKSLLQYQNFHKFIRNYIAGKSVIEIRPIRNNQQYLIAFESARDAAHVLDLCNADKGRVTLKPAGEGEKAKRSYPLVVLRVPNSISEEEFLELASEGGNPVLSATRLKSRARLGASIEKMKVIVDSLESRNDLLDRGFRLGYQRLPTESWLVAPSLPRCRFCQAYQHITKNCPGSIPKCGFCGEEHKSSECPKKTEPEAYRCANCGGRHRADNYECPLRKQVISELPQRVTYAEIVSLRARGMTPRDVKAIEAEGKPEGKQKVLLPEKTSAASRPAGTSASTRVTVVSNSEAQNRPVTQKSAVRQNNSTFPMSSNSGTTPNVTAVDWSSLFSDILGFFNSEQKNTGDLLQIIMKWAPPLLNLLGKLFSTPHHG